MQTERLDVNVHEHTIRARERNRQQRGLQGIMHQPAQSWWERWLPQWEDLVVAGREVKGLVVTPAMGLTIILAVGGIAGWWYKQSMSDYREQRDILIELRTRMEMKDSYDKQEFQKIHNRIDGTQEHQAAFETMVGQKLAKVKL